MKRIISITRLIVVVLFSMFTSSLLNAQNDCASALQVTDLTGVSCISTAPSATNALAGGGCEEGTLDTWFYFTAQGGSASITASSTQSGFRPEIVVVETGDNTCTGGFFLYDCFDQNGNYTSITGNVTGLVPGNNYWILVSSNGNLTSGTTSVCVNNPALIASCVDNQECSTAEVLTLNAPGSPAACFADCNNGATPGLDFVGNNCEDQPNPTVWYQFTTSATTASINVNLTSADLSDPEFAIYLGSACVSPWTLVNCREGSGGSASTTSLTVATNTTYVIAISDATGDVGNFNLCITQNPDNSACNTTDLLQVTATSMGSPLTGPFQPGEIVTYCYTITNFTQFNCNYLGAVIPEFGNCWDPVSFDAGGQPTVTSALAPQGVFNFTPPQACNGTPTGSWNWFPTGNVTYNNIPGGYYPANSNLPGGWFFLTSYDSQQAIASCAGPAEVDPDNSYGDSDYPTCSNNSLDWQVCFQLQAKDAISCAAGQTDCTVRIKTLSDGEYGAWSSIGCISDLPAALPGVLQCCPTFNSPGPQASCDSYVLPVITGSLLTGNEMYYSGTGGTSPFGGPWAAGATLNFADFGAYPVTLYITDTSDPSCTDEVSFSLTITETPTIVATNSGPVCIGQSFTLNETSGTATSWSWSSNGAAVITNTTDQNPTVTGAVNGEIFTVIGSVAGCSNSDQTTITINPLPVVTATNSGPICADAVSFTVDETGGEAVSWTWTSNGAAVITNSTDQNPTITGAINGEIFTVIGTDGNTCSNSAQTTITINPLPAVTATNSGPICAGTPSFTLNETGGVSTSWLWSSNGAAVITNTIDQNPTITGAINGEIFTVIGTDGNGCSNSDQTTLVINPLPVVIAMNSGPICADAASFTTNETGGASTSWLWSSNGAATITNTTDQNPTITGAVNGEIFTVIGTNAVGCSNSDQTTITINPLPVFTTAGTNPSVCGMSDGFITLSGLAATTGYNLSYLDDGVPVGPNPIVTDGAGEYIIAGLNAGNYTNITINDGTCTYVVASQSLMDPLAPTVTVVLTNSPTTCLGVDGTITLTGLIPLTGYMLTYNDNGVPVGPNPIITDGSGEYAISGLNAGTHTNFVVDFGGCIGTNAGPVTLTDPPLPNVVATNSGPICSGTASFTLNETGGNALTWSWSSNGAAVITNIGDQNPTVTGAINGEIFTVIGTDVNSCSNSAQTIITINSNPTVTATNSGPICSNVPSFSVNETGGQATSWSWSSNAAAVITNTTDQNPTITGAINGEIFTVVGTDGNGCSSSAQTTITINNIPTVTASNSGPICASAPSFTLNETGGQATIWSWSSNAAAVITNVGDQSPTITGAVNGEIFTVVGTDVSGCSNSAQTTITINPLPAVNATNSGPICSDAVSFSVDDIGGDASSWVWSSNGAAVITNTTDQNPTITGAVNGEIFTVVGTDGSGCSNSSQTTITINSLPVVNATNSGPICADDLSFSLDEIGGDGVSWMWSSNAAAVITNTTDQDPTVTGAVNGEIFTVVVTGVSGCTNTSQTTITINALPSVIATNSGPICTGAASFSLNETGGDASSWIWISNGAALITNTGDQNPSVSGAVNGEIFTVVSTDANGCSSSDQTILVINPLPNVIASNSGPICESATSFTLNETGGDATAWTWSSNGAATITNTTDQVPTVTNMAGGEIFTVIATDANGCQNSAQTTLVMNTLPTVTAINGGPYCQGEVMNVNETGGQATSWSWTSNGVSTFSNASAQNPSVSGAVDGEIFTVIGTDANGCSNSAQTQVVINATPNAPTATSDATYCVGTPVQDIYANGSGGTLTWYSDAALTNVISTGDTLTPGNTSAIYYVTEVANGCEGPSDFVVITMQNCGIVIPSAFTPDASPNKVWEIVDIDVVYPNNVVSIYNRWGNLIFNHESDPSNPYSLNPWDGTFNNEPLPVGSYYYIIEFNDANKEIAKGTVTIIRN